MASCKDCMHEEVCTRYAGDLNEDGAEKCECFKHRADVQEVRHGKWIYTSRSPEWADCKCSECGYTDSFANVMECFYNYCPECGAKMDKEREKND